MSKTIFNVYGETNSGWAVSSTKDERTLAVNKKYKVKTKEGKILDKVISLGVQRDVLGKNMELFDALVNKNRGRVYNFFGRNLNIKYSKKAMAPYAVQTQGKPKKRDLITLLTFDMRNKSIVDFAISSKGCILELAFDNMRKELSLITMMDTREGNNVRLLFKTNKGKYIQYKFTQKDMSGNIELETTIIPRYEVKPEILTQKNFQLKKFRPVFPASVILCEIGKYDEVLDLLSEKFNNGECEIREYLDKEELGFIYEGLREIGYRAITTYHTEYDEAKAVNDVDDVVSVFTTFKVINRLTKNGKITYLKK